MQALRGHRLLTIAGPGGIGKTQAALETARVCAADFPDGVWLFDCTPLIGGDALVQRVASMFDVRGTLDASELTARLCELLQRRKALLLFDNAERIAEPLAALADTLLAACASLHVLVTSQRRLSCGSESLYWLEPLAIPPPGKWSTCDEVIELMRVPAVQLLLLRLHAVAPRFALTPSNAPAIADICRRLDGMPLALELAAARLRMLSPEQLLARLDNHLLNLAEASPNRPARHQTLHALIEWSYALLSEDEQALLRGLGVFAGGCTLGGAHATGAAFGLGDVKTLDLLGGLIDKSLLGFDAGVNPPRYVLLDSVRLFALERLAESGEEERARDAHLAHFVDFTERVNAGILGELQKLWAERVRREGANLHTALDYALAQPRRTGDALALVSNLCWYFRGGIDYLQPAQWLEMALQANHSPTLHRARALIAVGMVMHQTLDHEHAGTRLREGIALAANLGDAFLAGAGQAVLAFELATCGDFAGAEACVQAALAIAKARDDAWVRSNALLSRGVMHSLNDRHREAEADMSEAVDCLPVHSDYFQRAYTLINRALQRFYLGDARGAAQDWLYDLGVFIPLQNWRGAAGCVEGTAYLAAESGRLESAARFLAAAARVRDWTGAPLMPQWRKAQQVAMREAREALGVAEFEHAWQAGAATRFEDVVAEARVLLSEIAAAQVPRSGASSPSGS
ncbi:AAA family ATPase [Rhodanobacter sp. DHB23]|uniref:ATP-binding protein n=1 Tax=Rhodanobacter sp. DHB23 TaxID=2775923 RepID=UPI001CE06B39|nr:AAA family ATPase [Rhodanobacter sp. DHB23]